MDWNYGISWTARPNWDHHLENESQVERSTIDLSISLRIQPQKYPVCLPSLVRRQRALFLTSLLKRYANPPQGDFNLWPWGGRTDSVWKMLEQIGRLTRWGSMPSPTTVQLALSSKSCCWRTKQDRSRQDQTGPEDQSPKLWIELIEPKISLAFLGA